MAKAVSSLQRLFAYLIIMLLVTIATLYIFHVFIAEPISLSKLFEQAVQIIIILIFSVAAVAIVRHFKRHMTQVVGAQGATLLQYILLAIVVVIMSFGILNILKVSATDLLASAGIISVTVGLVISTFVGSILSGFLVFTTYKFKEGDDVLVNNVPGRIVEMTALVMRIESDVGQVTIPNSAIASGGVIITAVKEYRSSKAGRLHYTVGDRVITSFMNEEGTVKQITAFQTVILLDSGREITFLNNSILSGGVTVARITGAKLTGTKTANS